MGAWLLIALNLLVSFWAIGILERMAPAIANILKKNEASTFACHNMAMILLSNNADNKTTSIEQFKEVLCRAQNNITEEGEKETLTVIENNYMKALSLNGEARKTVSEAIEKLMGINRKAMHTADSKAHMLCRGGAWGVAFMAVFVFITGLTFIRRIKTQILAPLEELKNVTQEFESGNTQRRCSLADLPSDFRGIFGSVNTLIDCCARLISDT